MPAVNKENSLGNDYKETFSDIKEMLEILKKRKSGDEIIAPDLLKAIKIGIEDIIASEKNPGI